MIENFPKKNNSCHTNLQVSATKMLLFTAQGPLIATIRGGIPSFSAQKPLLAQQFSKENLMSSLTFYDIPCVFRLNIIQ